MSKIVLAFSVLFFSAGVMAAGRLDVSQATYVFTDAKSISTAEASVNTCIAVAIHDPETSQLYFAHIDASVDVSKALGSALEKFDTLGIPKSRLRSYIAGGWDGWSNEFSKEARIYLKNAGVRNVSYESPIDIGYTLRDSIAGKPIPKKQKSKGGESRTFVFDLRRQRFYQTEPTLMPSNSEIVNLQSLVRGPLPSILPSQSTSDSLTESALGRTINKTPAAR